MKKFSMLLASTVASLGILAGSTLAHDDDDGSRPTLQGAWEAEVTLREDGPDCTIAAIVGVGVNPFRQFYTFHEGGTANEWGTRAPPATRGVGSGAWERTGNVKYRYRVKFHSFDANGLQNAWLDIRTEREAGERRQHVSGRLAVRANRHERQSDSLLRDDERGARHVMNAPVACIEAHSRKRLPFIAMAFCASVVHGSPTGELDNTLGVNGRLTIGSQYESTLGLAVAHQPADGKLIVAGATWVTPSQWYDFLVIRLNLDGSRDSSFGTDGATLIDFGEDYDIATDVAVQVDGKIIVAGYSGSSFGTPAGNTRDIDFALTRLNPDGSIDSTFGDGGRATLDLGGDDEYIAKIAVLPNGKIVIAGGTNLDGDFDVVFARFEANGALDSSFGGSPIGGTTRVDLGGSQEQPYSMALQSDGKLIACGHSGPVAYDSASGQMLAVRVNENGSVDAGFGTNGVSLVATGSQRGSGRGCIAMPDGKTLLAGFGGSAGNSELILARLASHGVLDTSFGDAGRSRIDAGGLESVQSIIRLADGNLAVSGSTAPLGSEAPAEFAMWGFDAPSKRSEMFIARFDVASGLLDADFGNGGITIADFGNAITRSMAFSRGLIQQADGNLLAVGDAFMVGPWWNFRQIALTRVSNVGGGNTGVASFVEESAQVREGTDRVTFSVRRTGGATGDLSIQYSTEPGSATAPGDFTATSGTLTWPSGDAAPQSITVDITDDQTREDFESFHIVLTGPGENVAFASAFVAINDDDPRPAPTVPAAPLGGGGGSGAIGIADLAALALISAFGLQRRRRFIRP